MWWRHIWLVKLSLVFTWGILDWNWGRPPESYALAIYALAVALALYQTKAFWPVGEGQSAQSEEGLECVLCPSSENLSSEMCRLAVGSLEPAGTFLLGGKWSFARSLHLVVGCNYITFTDSIPAVPQNDGMKIAKQVSDTTLRWESSCCCFGHVMVM